MYFRFKNDNLYYYNYPIFNGELSPVLFIAFIIIILSNKLLINYLSYLCIGIFLIGIFDSYLKYEQNHLVLILITNIIFHALFLYPLIDIKRYFRPNVIQFILLLFALLLIHYLPYWPYIVSRTTMSFVFCFIYLIGIIIYKFKYDIL